MTGPRAAAPDTTQEILEQRAARLARRRDTEDMSTCTEVVRFEVGGEQYGIALPHVREVVGLVALTPVPGTPPFVVGIIPVRGRVVSLLDLRVFFDLPMRGLHERSRALILASGQMEFAILVDSVEGTHAILPSQIETDLASLTGVRAEYLLGVCSDGTILLDGARLLADPQLVV